MRGLYRGESYLVTRNGVAVGELQPVRARRFISAEALAAAFANARSIEDQDAAPRA